MICCTIFFLIQLFPEIYELNFYFRQYNYELWLIKCYQAEQSEDFEKNCSIQIPICLLRILTNMKAAQ